MVEAVGDDETFARGMEKARAALGRPLPVIRPVPDPDESDELDPPPPSPPASATTSRTDDERDARIAALEAEVRHLRAALTRIEQEARHTRDP